MSAIEGVGLAVLVVVLIAGTVGLGVAMRPEREDA